MTTLHETKKIAIIGGGYTGLTAAYRLAQAGADVTVYEKESRVGGLVVGFEMHGQPIEKIYHFIYKTDQDVLDLLDELEMRDRLTFHDSSVATYYGGKLYPFMTPKDILMFSPLSFINRVRTGVVGLYLQKLTKWKPLTKITAYEWMRKYGGEQALKIIWEPLLKGKFGKYYDKVTMSWLWSRIHVRANSKDDTQEKLGYINGSFGVVIDGLVEKIKTAGGTVHVSTQLEGIVRQSDGQVVVNAGDKTDTFDAVIATTPTYIFDHLIKENAEAATAPQRKPIDYIGAVVAIFSSTQKISDYYWHNINDPKIPFLVFLSETALTGTDMFNGRHMYYVGVYVDHDHKYFETPSEDILNEWFSGIKEMFPDFDSSVIMEKHLFKFKNAQHIVDIGYEEKIPPYASVVPGVYLANFSQIFPDDRGMNYAIQEGNKIAARVIRDLEK